MANNKLLMTFPVTTSSHTLAEYRAPENYAARDCPLCKSGVPITRF